MPRHRFGCFMKRVPPHHDRGIRRNGQPGRDKAPPERAVALRPAFDSHMNGQIQRRGGTMSRTWQFHEAKARFSEFLEASVRDGPQIVTKHGAEAAVLLPIGQWRQLRKMAQPDLKELLLAPEARTETLVPPRARHDHRPTSAFE